jgi:CubicO group peptidase (beta-lactamase class C family)
MNDPPHSRSLNHIPERRVGRRHPPVLAPPLLLGSFIALVGCATEPGTAPTPEAPPLKPTAAAVEGFRWSSATPESQGMCGSIKQLGCTKTLLNVWNGIRDPRYNTKRFLVIRNDKVIYDRGGTLPYFVYSANKGLLGAPTLVYAMNRCGVGLTDRVSSWLAHGEGARWESEFPWTDITVEHLATHTSGICDYGNSSSVCSNENPGWQSTYGKADIGGAKWVYPNDAFTISRAESEQNRQPALAPGSTLEYSNVGSILLNYVVQRACGQKLTDIFDLYIKQPGMGSVVRPAVITTDDGQVFNQSTGVGKWTGIDGASVLRLAGRLGIWENRNVQPVRLWNLVTKTGGNIPAAAAAGWGVVFENNSKNMWTKSAGYRRLSLEMFGHGGNYSTIFFNDPLTGTMVIRQGENNAKGASYLTRNGCAPGWTGTSPTCTPGTDWSNNYNMASGTLGSNFVAPRKKVVEPLQQAFFFPPPFCRMVFAGGARVDNVTNEYTSAMEGTSIDLVAEIRTNPREGAGSSVADKVEFYKESGAGPPEFVGNGTLVPGTSPAQYQLLYNAGSHGAVSEVRTYFANCVARSTVDGTKKVPSYSRPVRVRRL